jgi:protocatechuate 3,4-dioxygenase beta subunit
LLSSIEDESARATLLAHPSDPIRGTGTYRFDIVLQGENETVFLDI